MQFELLNLSNQAKRQKMIQQQKSDLNRRSGQDRDAS